MEPYEQICIMPIRYAVASQHYQVASDGVTYACLLLTSFKLEIMGNKSQTVAYKFQGLGKKKDKYFIVDSENSV